VTAQVTYRFVLPLFQRRGQRLDDVGRGVEPRSHGPPALQSPSRIETAAPHSSQVQLRGGLGGAWGPSGGLEAQTKRDGKPSCGRIFGCLAAVSVEGCTLGVGAAASTGQHLLDVEGLSSGRVEGAARVLELAEPQLIEETFWGRNRLVLALRNS